MGLFYRAALLGVAGLSLLLIGCARGNPTSTPNSGGAIYNITLDKKLVATRECLDQRIRHYLGDDAGVFLYGSSEENEVGILAFYVGPTVNKGKKELTNDMTASINDCQTQQ